MKNSLVRKTTLAAALVVLLSPSGWAFSGDQKGPRLPPEAYAACEGKKAGDQVEFKNRRGEKVKAVCTEFEGRLLALPPKMPGKEKGPEMKGDFRREGRMDGSQRLERMSTALELTEEQKTRIRALFEAERQKGAPMREKMADHRAKLRQAVHGEGDETVIRALAAEGAALKADLLVSRARTWKEVQALLTPEQQRKAKQLAQLREKEGGGCRTR